MTNLRVITFSKTGHDDFIDFIKAYAIICVLFGHTFLWLDKVAYNVWAGMQVPLFILVQAFHFYKKDGARLNIQKILKRVFVPFILIEAMTIIIMLLFGVFSNNALIIKGLTGGGYGPGSYYPWVYLQVAFMLPLFGMITRKCNKTTSLFIFLIISEGIEIILSLIGCPEWLYRLLAVRYIFLIYLGWIWAKDGIVLNWLTILLTTLSLVAIVYFEYFSVNDQPWFFLTKWKTHRWPCYFFVANGLVAMLYLVWEKVKGNQYVKKAVKMLASCSYEIFLVQMITIYLFKWSDLTIIPLMPARYGVWLVVVWTLSIFGGAFLKKAFARFI